MVDNIIIHYPWYPHSTKCSFNEEMFYKNKDKYHVYLVDDKELVNSTCNAKRFLCVDGVRDFMKNVVGSIYKDALKRNCFTTEYDECYNEYVKYYNCLVIIDIEDVKLRSKCKLLNIETKLVMRLHFEEDTDNLLCTAINLCALDINV